MSNCCAKCGKEIKANEAFCPNCGAAAVQAGAVVQTGASGWDKERKHRGDSMTNESRIRFPVVRVLLVVLLLIGGAAGIIFWQNTDFKYIREAKRLIEAGSYEKALEQCEAAINQDGTKPAAYYVAADAYMAMDKYRDAEEMLIKGKANVKKAKQAQIEEKLSEVYRAQAKRLVGVWRLNYDLTDLLGGIGEAVGNFVELEVPVMLEFTDKGMMSFYLEPEAYAEAKTVLSNAAGGGIGALFGGIGAPIGAFVGKKAADYYIGKLLEEGSVEYAYRVDGNVLYCEGAGEGAGEYSCSFAIDGSVLRILEERALGEKSTVFRLPPEIWRVE